MVFHYGHPSLLQFPEFISHPLDQTRWHMGSAELDFELFPSHHLSCSHCANTVPPCSCISGQIVGSKQHFLVSFHSCNFHIVLHGLNQSSASRGSSDLVKTGGLVF